MDQPTRLTAAQVVEFTGKWWVCTDPDGDASRHKLIENGGAVGYWIEWSGTCSGCTNVPENTSPPSRGMGCRECGYTGRRIQRMFIQCDPIGGGEYIGEQQVGRGVVHERKPVAKASPSKRRNDPGAVARASMARAIADRRAAGMNAADVMRDLLAAMGQAMIMEAAAAARNLVNTGWTAASGYTPPNTEGERHADSRVHLDDRRHSTEQSDIG